MTVHTTASESLWRDVIKMRNAVKGNRLIPAKRSSSDGIPKRRARKVAPRTMRNPVVRQVAASATNTRRRNLEMGICSWTDRGLAIHFYDKPAKNTNWAPSENAH